VHVSDVALAPAPDRTIWAHAREHGLVIVSKDEDFHRFSVLHGPPPKVIWIRLGNCSTDDVIRLLRMRREEIEEFIAQEEAQPGYVQSGYLAGKRFATNSASSPWWMKRCPTRPRRSNRAHPRPDAGCPSSFPSQENSTIVAPSRVPTR
jgi:predicted nuclease of predicted toxin-antitoxin system